MIRHAHTLGYSLGRHPSAASGRGAPYTGEVITADQYRHIGELIAAIADAEVLTRFRALSDADIDEKNPGDLVTVADRLAEERLTEALQAYLPGSVTVGEETVSADPTVMDRLNDDTPTWIIDPVDGTSNFVAGDPDYCCLVSLSTGDTTHASWIYAPSLGLTAGAHTGHGAWINGETATMTPRPARDGLDIVTTHPNYTDGYRTINDKLSGPDITRTPCRTAGLSYVDLVQGRYDAVVYTWQFPWDHAAGLHLHTMLGGENTTMDGTPFKVTGGNALPFVAGTPAAVAALSGLLHA
jgi:fructose-1,6-bisphosphatase/inositol monophosphatase family enzyme